MTTLVLPAKVRAIVYALLSVVGLAVGAAQVGFAAANEPNPTWLTVALAVVPFLASGLGAVALTHTPKAEYVGEHRAPEDAPVHIANVHLADSDAIRRQAEAYRVTAKPTGPTDHGDGYTSGVGKRD